MREYRKKSISTVSCYLFTGKFSTSVPPDATHWNLFLTAPFPYLSDYYRNKLKKKKKENKSQTSAVSLLDLQGNWKFDYFGNRWYSDLSRKYYKWCCYNTAAGKKMAPDQNNRQISEVMTVSFQRHLKLILLHKQTIVRSCNLSPWSIASLNLWHAYKSAKSLNLFFIN